MGEEERERERERERGRERERARAHGRGVVFVNLVDDVGHRRCHVVGHGSSKDALGKPGILVRAHHVQHLQTLCHLLHFDKCCTLEAWRPGTHSPRPAPADTLTKVSRPPGGACQCHRAEASRAEAHFGGVHARDDQGTPCGPRRLTEACLLAGTLAPLVFGKTGKGAPLRCTCPRR